MRLPTNTLIDAPMRTSRSGSCSEPRTRLQADLRRPPDGSQAAFDGAIPDAKDFRDLLEPLDEYVLGQGKHRLWPVGVLKR
jgi:hypothetical protein